MRFWPFRKWSPFARTREASVHGDDASLERAAEELAEESRLGGENATAQIMIVGEQFRAGVGGESVRRSYAAIQRYLEAHPPGSDCGPCRHPADGLGVDARRLTQSRNPGAVRRTRALPPPLTPETQAGLGAIASFGCDSPQGLSNVCTILVALPEAGGLPGVACAVVLLANGPDLDGRRLRVARQAIGDPRGQRSFDRSVIDPQAPPEDDFGFAGFVFGNALRLQAVRYGKPFSLLHPMMAWELGER